MKRIRCKNCTHGKKQHCPVWVVSMGMYQYHFCMKPNCNCDQYKGDISI